LLNIRKVETERRFLGLWPAGILIVAGLMLLSIFILRRIDVFAQAGPYSIERIQSDGNIMTIGRVLYTKYLLPFEIASLILLVAIIGAIVLAKKEI